MSVTKEIAVAVLPTLVQQVGEGVREYLKERREEARCEHGRPGGRLCSKCAEAKAKPIGGAGE